MTIQELWKDVLSSADMPEPIVSPDELDEVIAFLIDTRINMQVFVGNLGALLSQGRQSINLFAEQPPMPTSQSISHFVDLVTRPMAPMWMLAAFPDVFDWINEIQDDLENSSSSDVTDDMLRLYGIEPESEEAATDEVEVNQLGQIKAKYCWRLVDNYQAKTGRSLEVAVTHGSSNDFYAGSELLGAIGQESNFTLIASMTAKFFAELMNTYGDRFPNKTSLIAASGILDATVYINVTHQITPEQIVSMAEASEQSPDPFLEFVIRLETLMLSVDTPDYSVSEIENACREQRNDIAQAIGNVLARKTHESQIVQAVHMFMNSRKNKRIRKLLGVSRR